MKKAIAAAFLLALAGSTAPVDAKDVITPHGASMLQAGSQDQPEQQLRHLEQLAARVAKLEDEVTRLEEKNKQLRAQLATNGPGGLPGGVPGQAYVGPGGSVESKGK